MEVKLYVRTKWGKDALLNYARCVSQLESMLVIAQEEVAAANESYERSVEDRVELRSLVCDMLDEHHKSCDCAYCERAKELGIGVG